MSGKSGKTIEQIDAEIAEAREAIAVISGEAGGLQRQRGILEREAEALEETLRRLWDSSPSQGAALAEEVAAIHLKRTDIAARIADLSRRQTVAREQLEFVKHGITKLETQRAALEHSAVVDAALEAEAAYEVAALEFAGAWADYAAAIRRARQAEANLVRRGRSGDPRTLRGPLNAGSFVKLERFSRTHDRESFVKIAADYVKTPYRHG